ncbi:Uncharacterised protein [Segatella copri]|nr:Uncharacterised protein [Segatella copri]
MPYMQAMSMACGRCWMKATGAPHGDLKSLRCTLPCFLMKRVKIERWLLCQR